MKQSTWKREENKRIVNPERSIIEKKLVDTGWKYDISKEKRNMKTRRCCRNSEKITGKTKKTP